MNQLQSALISVLLPFILAATSFLLLPLSPRQQIAPAPATSPSPQREEAEEHLEVGRKKQEHGDYAAAAEAYELALAAGAEELEVLLPLGESYLGARNYRAAISTLRRFIESYPGDNRRPRALLLLAKSYQGAGDWKSAIEFYRRSLVWGEEIAGYIHERIGDCYLRLNQPAQAIEAYKEAQSGGLSPARAFRIMEKIAKTCTEMGDYRRAARWYETILGQAKSERYRAEIGYMAGQAHLKAGEREQAYLRFGEVIDSYPSTRHAYLSLVELVNAGVKVDEFQRGLVDYYNGAFVPSAEAFERYIRSRPEKRLDEAYYYAALSYQKAGDYEQAARRLEILMERFPESELYGQAWLARAGVLAESGDYEGAVKTYLDFVSNYPQSALSPQALWKRAELAETTERFTEAAQSYIGLQKKYPHDEGADDALFRAGLCYFRAASYEEAAQTLQALLSTYPGTELRARSFLWLGKSLQKAGKAQEAQENLTRLGGGDYYSLRARELARGGLPFAAPGQDDPTLPPMWKGEGEQAAERAECEAWLRDWSLPQVHGTSEVPRTELEEAWRKVKGMESFQRGWKLFSFGLRAEALEEFESLKDAFQEDPLALYRLALFFQEEGFFGLSVSCAKRLIYLSPGSSISKAPLFLQKLAYPLYFQELIVPEALDAELDPLLLFALIRQESFFEPQATSWAGASGLAQVMPETGQWIAEQLGWEDFQTEDLYKPYLSIRFGAWYLAFQLNFFGGDALAALAAYNAGPGRVAHWLYEEADSDDDLFMEIFPLEEPRLYVRMVYEHYNVYVRLYRK